MEEYNKDLLEDLIRLRDEFSVRAFDQDNKVRDKSLAEAVWKINSCLYNGYPRKH